MRIAVSGTYSSGKTTTSIALSHLTGIPRTHAKTMREILPEVVPGRRLEECTIPELFQLGMIRYSERAVHESHLPGAFISDGSALHEWVYGKIRTHVGIHPTDDIPVAEASDETAFFDQVIDAIGAVARRHAVRSYDVFIHLPIEFDLVSDGHRPVSERFRRLSDELLLRSLTDLSIPHHIVSGSIVQRLETIVDVLSLPQVLSVEEALERTEREIFTHDVSDELSRGAVR